jgi:hypothetical protein
MAITAEDAPANRANVSCRKEKLAPRMIIETLPLVWRRRSGARTKPGNRRHGHGKAWARCGSRLQVHLQDHVAGFALIILDLVTGVIVLL